MSHCPKLLCLTALAAMVTTGLPALAADNETESKWRDQESWQQFVDKEQGGGFKVNKPKVAPKPDSVLAPVLSKTKPSSEPDQSYVLMPGQQAPVQQPQVQIETEMVPVVQRGWGWTGGWPHYGWNNGGWNSWNHGYYPGSGWWGPGYGGYVAPSTVSMRPISRIVQTGPSHASGNCYNPPTPDPSASGNYYTPQGGLPKAAPIIRQGGDRSDYWGNSGNPLPGEMQP